MSALQSLPTYRWSTLVKNVVMIDTFVYQCEVEPRNVNEPGATELILVGFILEDNLGNRYTIQSIISVTGFVSVIQITDDFQLGDGPLIDREGYVCQTVDDGDAPYIAQPKYDNFDRSAESRTRGVDMDILWRNMYKYWELAPDTPASFVPLYAPLYNWWAVNNPLFISTIKAHLPIQSEWEALSVELGGDTVSGGHLKEAGLSHWLTPNTGADNSSGFTALPAGARLLDGTFEGIGEAVGYWLPEDDGAQSRAVGLAYTWSSILLPTGLGDKNGGYSIRLIIDTPDSIDIGSTTGTYIGNDGKVYPIVLIGTQWWLACNLCETKYRDGTLIPNVTDATAWSLLSTGAYCDYNNNPTNSYVYTPSTPGLRVYSKNFVNILDSSFITWTKVRVSDTEIDLQASLTSELSLWNVQANSLSPISVGLGDTVKFVDTQSVAWTITAGSPNTIQAVGPISKVNTSSLFSTGLAGTWTMPAIDSIFLGGYAGNGTGTTYQMVGVGKYAAYNTTGSNGLTALGAFAGSFATNVHHSLFAGYEAGYLSVGSFYAINLGYYTGVGATSPYSFLAGYNVGYYAVGYTTSIGANNIIIGTNISLNNGVANAINLGSVLFAINTHSDTTTAPSIVGQSSGKFGVSIPNPLARMHLPAGTASSYMASLKIDPGVLLTTPESGAIEPDGSHIYWTNAAGTRLQLDNVSSGTVGGSGTTGYIPKWTSSVNLGNSPMFTDGTNIGLGTTSMSYLLDILGTSDQVIRIKGSSGGGWIIGDGVFSTPSGGAMWASGVTPDYTNYTFAVWPSGLLYLNIPTGGYGINLSIGGSEMAGLTASGGFYLGHGYYGEGPYPLPVIDPGAGKMIIEHALGVGLQTPLAYGHFAGSASSSDKPSLILNSGTLISTLISGAIENTGTHIYWTNSSGTRYQLDQQTGTGTMVYPGVGLVISTGSAWDTSLVASGHSLMAVRVNSGATGFEFYTPSTGGGMTWPTGAGITISNGGTTAWGTTLSVLLYTLGGTGLTTLGTAGQSYRVNSGATAIEWYTPSAGITYPTTGIVIMGASVWSSSLSVLPYTLGGTGLTTLGTAGQSYRVNAGGTAIEWYTPATGSGMTWPTGSYGIPIYTGSSAWDSSTLSPTGNSNTYLAVNSAGTGFIFSPIIWQRVYTTYYTISPLVADDILNVSTSLTEAAISGQNTSSSGGIGVYGYSAHSAGIWGRSDSTYAGSFSINQGVTNVVLDVLQLSRGLASGTLSSGLGEALVYYLQSNRTGASTYTPSGRISNVWTDVTMNYEYSKFTFDLLQNGVISTKMELNGYGQLKLTNYGVGTFTGTATKWLAVDSSGNIIEQPSPSGGSMTYPSGSGITIVSSGTSWGTTLSVLPYTLGGTGLTTLGTALQSYRVNSAGTAIEWYTPSSGIGYPASGIVVSTGTGGPWGTSLTVAGGGLQVVSNVLGIAYPAAGLIWSSGTGWISLTLGTNLSITGTTLNAAGGGGGIGYPPTVGIVQSTGSAWGTSITPIGHTGQSLISNGSNWTYFTPVYTLDDLVFEFRDINPAVSQTYILDIYASWAYTINELYLQTDPGCTITISSIQINTIPVVWSTSIIVPGSPTILNMIPSSANSVVLGNQVIIVTSGTSTGTPTSLRGKLTRQRV